jgi:hypothetical protein
MASSGIKSMSKQLDSAQKRIDDKTQPDTAVTQAFEMPRGGVFAEGASYPAKYVADTEPQIMDKSMYYEKVRSKQTAEGYPLHQAITTIPFTDQDVAALKEKERLTELKNFDQWLMSKYNVFGDPNTQKWMTEVYPEFYNARESQIEDMLEMQKRVNRIGIRGVHDKDDLFLVYKMSTDPDLKDMLTRAPGPVPTARTDIPDQEDRYVRGLWKQKMKQRRTEVLPTVTAGSGPQGVPTYQFPQNMRTLSFFSRASRERPGPATV